MTELAPNLARRRVAGLPDLGRCAVMGVVNVTPDSFSDGGDYFEPGRAVEHGLAMLAAGVDYLDVGGESTRPGADRVAAAEELRRVLPVIAGLARAGAVVSVDTTRAEVAEQAVAAGARIVNDVSGGQADPAMIPFVSQARLPYILMHWRGHSADMNDRAQYRDVLGEVCGELGRQLGAAVAGGIDPERIVLDPGFGFAKQAAHDWALAAGFERLGALGRPVLAGPSRKRFLGRLLAGPDGAPRPAAGRDTATLALAAILAARGAWAVRVHAAAEAVDAVKVAAAATDPRYLAVPGPAGD
ncbi:MAG TPA: dihydropteroate synthase [Actinocrinis sp.]|nr:dihydropteroate synthase [Actinocrinis sp.]